MRVTLWPDGRPGGALLQKYETEVGSEQDFTGRVRVRGLEPDTAYTYQVRFEAGPGPFARPSDPIEGRFRSAPTAQQSRALRVAFGGDLAGQNVCRDAERGFPIFREISTAKPDLFIGLGDMIYGDGVCESRGRYGNQQVPGLFGPATDIEGYRAHWRYSREDPHLASLLAEAAYLPIWDDHEVTNDFGPHPHEHDPGAARDGAGLLDAGLQAFLDYNPVDQQSLAPPAGVPGPLPSLHRSFRWGRHLELFVLDTRRQRDANDAPDRDGSPKTLLGPAQRRWLTHGLASSDASWKVVVSSVPISVPTGSATARDGWSGLGGSTGFQRELRAILASLHAAGVRNMLWITTDVHFASVFRYDPFAEEASAFLEVVTGPLNAGLFPSQSFDPALRAERLFFYGPASADAVGSYRDALGWFNFGLLDVAENGTLTIQIVNGRGEPVYRARLETGKP